MIFLDNAATTRQKPEVVHQAFSFYMREIGVTPGRGSYSLAIDASRMLYQARKTTAMFFGAPGPDSVAFTKNSTEAINLFFRGYLKKGDAVLISPFEHNAVLRPLHALKEAGVIDYKVFPEAVIDNPVLLKECVDSRSSLMATTLASNLTGQIVFSSKLAAVAHELGLKVFVDASQGAGKKLIDMKRDGIDVLAFTGHKDMLAYPGVGGLVSTSSFDFPPMIQGGMGVHGEYYVNPDIYPDAYEAGTINMPAIWSLKRSIEYVNENIKSIIRKENELLQRCIEGLSEIPKVILYRKDVQRVPTFCFNIEGTASNVVVDFLNRKNICVRGGIHCAIKAHETLGTVTTGAVRVSINHNNTEEDVDALIDSIKEFVS